MTYEEKKVLKDELKSLKFNRDECIMDDNYEMQMYFEDKIAFLNYLFIRLGIGENENENEN